MTQAGYQEGSERHWWWKVAQRLDEAQLALANAAAHNTGDPGPVIVLQDRMREAQAILLHIFREKGLVPAATNGAAVNGANGANAAADHAADSAPPLPVSVAPSPPIEMPPPPPPPAGWAPGPGSWVPAAPEAQEDAASTGQESAAPESEETPIAVQADVVSAPPSADSTPEA